MTWESRFWAKVDRREPDECWLWKDAPSAAGYGTLSVSGQRQYAHRLSYELHKGPIPDGLQIDHVRALGCTSRLCVNPGHLEAVTSRDNTLRGDANKWRAAISKCPKGHPLAGDNLYTYKNMRGCRTCRRERSRAWNRRAAHVG